MKEQVLENDRPILASARETELGRRLMKIPGVGPLLASAIVATDPDLPIFRSGRNLAAWIGLARRQNSSDGGGALCRAEWRQAAMAGAVARPAEGQGRRGRARKQECPHDLGNDGQRRTLLRAAGGMRNTARAIAPDEVGRAIRS